MGDDQQHGHAPMRFGVAFAVGAGLNIGLVAAQVIWGIAANSMALLADAVHNGGDVLGLLLAWAAFLMARRQPTAQRTYGWGRGTILAALVNAVVLLVSVGAIAAAAGERLLAGSPVAERTVMWVAGAGIVINGLTAVLFARGHEDMNIRAIFMHMAADAAISAGVLVAAVAILFTGRHWIDPLVGLAIAGLIMVGTWGLLRDSMNLAMDGVPGGIAEHEVKAWLGGLPGVEEVHDLHIWALSTTETALTAHLVRAEQADGQALISAACQGLGVRFKIHHATVQVETAAVAAACRLRPEHVV